MFAESWFIPFAMLPGVSMLIMSTSTRLSNVHSRVMDMPKAERLKQKNYVMHQLRRGRLFRNALVCLYSAIAFFVISALVAYIGSNWGAEVSRIFEITLFIAVFLVLTAAVHLIYESFLALQTIRKLCGFLDEDEPKLEG